MTAPSAPPPAAAAADGKPGLRGALVRFGIFALIVGALAALALLTPAARYLEREALAALLSDLRQAWWAPLLLVGSYLLISPSGIPISPLIFAGGAVFGPLWGWIYNTVGSMLGALLSHRLASALGKDLVEHLAGERRMQRVEAMLAEHGFWTLVGIRFLPIPFALINYGSALAGFRFGRFLAATCLGLVPSILFWTYLAHAIVSAATEERGALLRNASLIVGLVAVLMLLRPLGRLLMRRDEGAE